MFTIMRDKKAFRYINNILKIIFSVVIILSFIVLTAFIIELLKGKNIKETFWGMVEATKFIGGVYLLIFLILLPFSLSGLLIETAVKNNKGKAYKIVEFVNGVSIIILVLEGFHFVIKGLYELYMKHLPIFITVICAGAFAIYYWYKKKYI